MKAKTRTRAKTTSKKSPVIFFIVAGLICVASVGFAFMMKKQAEESVALADENLKLARQQNTLLDSLADALQKDNFKKDSIIKALRSKQK